MTTASSSELACPGCGRKFRLRAAAMGKKIKCNCGHVFVAEVPAPSPGVTDDLLEDTIPTAEPPTPAKAASRPTSPAAPPRLSPVVKALLDGEDEAQISTFRERWFPAGILTVGLIAHVVLWVLWLPTLLEVIICTAVALVVQVFVFSPLMLGSLTLLAKWFDVSFGDMRSTLWKIIALTLGPAAAADVAFTATLILANFDWQIIAAGFGFYLVLYGISAAIVFELGVAETAFLVAINFVPRIAAGYPAAVVLQNLTWLR